MNNNTENPTHAFPCPEPEYIRARSIKFVGDWTGDSFAAAERLLKESPDEFVRILEQATQEEETTASPIAPLAKAVRTEFKAMLSGGTLPDGN